MSAPDNTLHEVDGIKEEDNHLPKWWLATFYIAIVFSFFYWEYFHVTGAGALPMAELEQAQKEREARFPKKDEVTDESLLAMSKGAEAAAGQEVFKTTCMVCHGEKGEGKIGPNLTDGAWIHGGKPTDIYRSVAEGYALKGMPAWKPQLGGTKVAQATAYLLTIKDTNVPGKAPEGPPPADSPAPTAAPAPTAQP